MGKYQSTEDCAVARMQIVTPLLDESLDYAGFVALKKRIAEEHGISYRTVGRYLEKFRADGFTGLKPKVPERGVDNKLPANYEFLVSYAVDLRLECPSRSVQNIIKIMELEGKVQEGELKRSTLQHHLQRRGYGNKQMRMYTQTGVAARRFQKEHRLELLQGDIKYGPYLPIGKKGEKKQIYLAAFIDDATRYMVSASFYDNMQVEVIEDCLRQAVMGFGKPDAIFVDNGLQYRSEWLKKACAKLGIKLKFAKPYSPEAKGKIEAFNRRVDSFFAEVALEKCDTLAEFNDKFRLWVNEYYHKQPHHGLNGATPEAVFKADSRPLKFIPQDILKNAFLHTETRLVDKTGCISFNNTKYEVGMKLIGRKVEVYFDPNYKDEVEIQHPDFKAFKAFKQVIGTYCSNQKAALPPVAPTKMAHNSKLLEGLRKKRKTQDSLIKQPSPLSFKHIFKGGASDV